MTMIEKAARALNPDAFNEEIADSLTMEAYQIRRREKAREQVRAVLTAIRDVPDEMLGIHPAMDIEAARKYRAQYVRVIDAILGEKPE